ncbi:MAG: carboxypeptidase-like regulatory domain-containing protein [Prevotella sp.]|nr:carboxypeptidase-like regulatory domain-containing protein [Prevotella sp.]MDY5259297.1 carboxypeptidase-like regulatory domain-containing protein [Prevotella sp.]
MAVFFVFAVPASAQNKVTGTVVDSNGDPVIGATILVKGTQNGSVTDLDGNFTLDNVASKSTLVVSYVGMKTQNVELNGRNSLHITLADDADSWTNWWLWATDRCARATSRAHCRALLLKL